LSAEFYKNVMNIGVNMLEGRVFLRSTPEQLLAQYEDLLTNSGLLEKHNKHIENHLIANKVSAEMNVAEAIADSTFAPPLAVTENIEIVRDCPAGKEFNPLTKRCVKVCESGKVRNPNFRCVKAKLISEKVCPAGKELNTHTRRCVKTCKSGQVRNASFKCVKDKIITSKVCSAGKEFNPTTKRCVKTCKSGQVRNASFKCVREAGQRKTRKAKKSKSPEIINIFSRDA
jgi:hypothetical protein